MFDVILLEERTSKEGDRECREYRIHGKSPKKGEKVAMKPHNRGDLQLIQHQVMRRLLTFGDLCRISTHPVLL